MNGVQIHISGKSMNGEQRAITAIVRARDLEAAGVDANERIWLELDRMFSTARKSIDPRTLSLEIGEMAPGGITIERQSEINRRRYEARLIQAAGGKIVVRDVDKRKPIGNVTMHRDNEKGETTWMVEELPAATPE